MNNNWVSLHNHSHFSLLDAISKAPDIAKRCKELGMSACALSDHGGINGVVEFASALKKHNIKSIFGNEFYLSNSDATIQNKDNGLRNMHHLVALAKNQQGWKQLIRATSRSNDSDVYYHRPRLDLSLLSKYCDGNLISFSGHPGSQLANILFTEKKAYGSQRPETYVKDDAVKLACGQARHLQDIFGKDNFFIEIQLIDSQNMPAVKIIADILREVSKKTGIPCVATADSHYVNKKDAVDQRILLCSAMQTTLPKVNAALDKNEDVGLGSFFKSDNFHLPSPEEMGVLHTPEELENSCVINDMCEDYSILHPPILPGFNCPDGMNTSTYLTELCRDGWRNKLSGLPQDKKDIYVDRVKSELGIIKEANLSGYFLIVQDYVSWAKNQGWLVGCGRGSSSGSIVSYLLNITTIDPIKYNLLFSRFYNAGRKGSIPDIDIDFPKFKRHLVIDYITEKYGKDNVGQIVTFGRLMGRGALKEVLRVHDACPHNISNQITKCLPDEPEIIDLLEESGETSIINWTLKNEPDRSYQGHKLSEFCTMNDDETLVGEYAAYFEQAARLEGTFRTQSKHAAGVLISDERLDGICPMVRDKSGNKIVGFEMKSAEKIGLTKYDVLGTTILDKLMGANSLLEHGEIR